MRLLLAPLLGLCLVLSGVGLDAQPALGTLWARHDALLLRPREVRLPGPPARGVVFSGTGGRRVQGWDTGPAEGPVVLSWMGGPGQAVNPDRLADPVADPARWRFLAIDPPGVGDGTSTWVPRWRPEDTVDDAAAFLKRQGITGPVLVTGWSWGSTMALLFAQRHPEWTRGVVVGGVWANTPAEVRRYLDREGTRALIPGLAEAFSEAGPGRDAACALHRAIRDGRGGPSLAAAYGAAEARQCVPDQPLREPAPKASIAGPAVPVDMATCPDPETRFAFIESEMMCRGQRGRWRLRMRFPRALASTPLVVIQGRYDQVCDPQTAVRVVRAWPGGRKRLVPLNVGHWGFQGPTEREWSQAGGAPDQLAAVRRALALRNGDPVSMVAAALELLP